LRNSQQRVALLFHSSAPTCWACASTVHAGLHGRSVRWRGCAMSIAQTTGLNPVVCGLVVMIAGDAVLYYPVQSASSLLVYERGHLTAPEIFRFGVWMTFVAYVVVLAVALPYWAMVGEPLRLSPGP
jgi:hypothetical protein